jgi:hypothetical protein
MGVKGNYEFYLILPMAKNPFFFYFSLSRLVCTSFSVSSTISLSLSASYLSGWISLELSWVGQKIETRMRREMREKIRWEE